MFETLVNSFDGVISKGSGWLARCPAHDDRKRSLSIDIGRDGDRLVLKCFAQCTVESIVAAKGLTMADLRLGEASKPSAPAEVTIDSLAASKALPVEVLKRYGVRTVRDMAPGEKVQHGINGSRGVWIPYYNPDGSIGIRTRHRTAHVAKDGSKWLGSMGAILPYGLHDLADARDQGLVCLCEGETDYWSLRAAGIPALGLPGAQMVSSLQREHLKGIQAVYVCQDSDTAGAAFVSGIRQHVASWELSGVYAVPMPSGCKDVNDVYRRDAKGFSDRFAAMLQKAAADGAPAPREFTTAGDINRLTVPEWGLVFELEQLRRSSWGELTGELAVISDAAGDVFRGSVNVSNIERRQSVAQQIAKRSGLPDVDWSGLFEDFAIRSLKAERTAGEVVNLQDVALPTAEQTWEIDKFVLSRRDATCLFGDGGSGKSLIAVYLAGVLARQGIKVLYLDAEWNSHEHKERLVSLFGDEVPPLLYLEQRRPLESSAQQIRRHIVQHKIEFIVLDSVGLLTVGAPEESAAALGYSRTVQSFGVGSLSLAHIRKPQNSGHEIKPQDQKPFGSVFYHNLFRRTYFIKADGEASTEGDKQVGIWNPKSNHRGPGQKPFGLTFHKYGAQTVIEHVELAEIESLAPELPLRQRIKEALNAGPMTSTALADELGVKDTRVTCELTKGKKAGRFSKLSDERGSEWVNC